MKDRKKRSDGLFCAEIGETFDGPIAHVDVVVVNRAHENVECAIGLDAAVAEEPDAPQRVRARSLLAMTCFGFEPVDRGYRFFNIQPSEIELDSRGAHR